MSGAAIGEEFYNPLYKATIRDNPIYDPSMIRFAGMYNAVRARMEMKAAAAAAPRRRTKSKSAPRRVVGRPSRYTKYDYY